ncbi:hypothetical protein COCON_G00102710 [Conger conger]|uniref:Uncharacterized protein n=1 Tax=Conger conger TaxID=82655 RepID=A0A9Q1DHV2_CONCO|nr:hypothetical protein COCON_G00102710 [Conger conger]
MDVSSCLQEHDYCVAPNPAALDDAQAQIESLTKRIEFLQKQLETVQLQSKFSLRRFAGSDEDIRFYTRFATYEHFMCFWHLIEPSTSKIVSVSRAKGASTDLEEKITLRAKKLAPVDELFLFLMHLSWA